jgi:pimeloyl-ACP methyl ester carboxylesterase
MVMSPSAEPWTHHFATVNGIRLHYVEAGSGPLVVLLHGFPEFWYSWRHQLPALAAAGFRVIAPDLRGYGESDKPPGVQAYRIECLTGDVLGLIRHLGYSSAHIVGHDWGGAIAWSMPMQHPTAVERLAILNAPHPAIFFRQLGRPWQLLKSWYIFFFQIPWLPECLFRSRDFAGLLRNLRRDPVRPDAFSADDIACYRQALARPGALTAAINYYRAAFRRSPERQLLGFKAITQPTLVIWGERDRYLDVRLLEGLPAWVPDLRVERLADASHWVQNDAPERVNELLVRFLTASR